MKIANFCPEEQVLFFLLFMQGKQVTHREENLSQDQQFVLSVRYLFSVSGSISKLENRSNVSSSASRYQ